ncbi:MAG: GNAT family N-acetyltransferase [Aeromicrobium sp.]
MTLVVRSAPIDDAEAMVLLRELDAEYVRRWGHGDDSAVLPEEFEPPRGEFFVARLDDEPVGTGGWRLDGGVGEIKRMYVRQSAQRRGVARALLDAVEQSASDSGVHRLVLVTGELQPEATALYRSSGYTDIEPFGVYADGPSATFLGKVLSPATRG